MFRNYSLIGPGPRVRMPDSPFHTPPFLACVHCNHPILVNEPPIREYFEGQSGVCFNENCRKTFPWWDCVLRSLKMRFLFGPFAGIGARTTIFCISLSPEQIFPLTFSEFEIPSSARILQINYTPQGNGNLFPLEVHGNTPIRHFIPSKVMLWPKPFGPGPCANTKIAVAVTWIPSSDDDTAWQNLVEAFEAYSINRLNSVILPANVAVESTLSRLLTHSLVMRGISSKWVRHCLESGATYSHQLNVLLPALTSLIGAPALPDHIRGGLNRLRDLRNDIAHDGKPEAPLTDSDAALCLCAALFGFHYLGLVQEHIDGIRPPLRPVVEPPQPQSQS